MRASVVWAGIALGLAVVSQGSAVGVPLDTGRVVAGHWTYLAVLATLAAALSVLNARTPGGGAWAILMALLVVVFLIPWLEGAGLGRGAGGLERLRLENPWTIFYGLVVIAGTTNFFPTRYVMAALLVALACLLEYAALAGWVGSPTTKARLWSVVPWCLALACLAAETSRGETEGRRPVDALWLWFRDHWGVVWALRVQERFNRSAEGQAWPFRLTWHGIEPMGDAEIDEASAVDAHETLRGLLRRFARVEVLDRAAAVGGGCGPSPPG